MPVPCCSRVARGWRCVTALVTGFGAYQGLRAREFRDEVVFSARFVDAIRGNETITRAAGAVALTPADAETERLLRDAIGRYFEIVLRLAGGREQAHGVIAYPGVPLPPAARRFDVRYLDGVVRLVRRASDRASGAPFSRPFVAAATRLRMWCNWRTPSVSEAGPGCRMNADLIS